MVGLGGVRQVELGLAIGVEHIHACAVVYAVMAVLNRHFAHGDFPRFQYGCHGGIVLGGQTDELLIEQGHIVFEYRRGIATRVY